MGVPFLIWLRHPRSSTTTHPPTPPQQPHGHVCSHQALTSNKRYYLWTQHTLNTDTLHKSKKILPKCPLSHIATLAYFFAKLPAWWFLFFRQIDSEDVSIIAKLPVPIFFRQMFHSTHCQWRYSTNWRDPVECTLHKKLLVDLRLLRFANLSLSTHEHEKSSTDLFTRIENRLFSRTTPVKPIVFWNIFLKSSNL